ncbi:hypothetical protein CSW60_15930 [Caulobacter sp. X]|nr:hypothetical protein CSW60_15930 [Caulobacter sp. X]
MFEPARIWSVKVSALDGLSFRKMVALAVPALEAVKEKRSLASAPPTESTMTIGLAPTAPRFRSGVPKTALPTVGGVRVLAGSLKTTVSSEKPFWSTNASIAAMAAMPVLLLNEKVWIPVLVFSKLASTLPVAS